MNSSTITHTVPANPLIAPSTAAPPYANLASMLVWVLLPAYVLLCARLRFRRRDAMLAKYGFATRESLASMTSVQAQEIQRYLMELEFPKIFFSSLQFALFKVSLDFYPICFLLLGCLSFWRGGGDFWRSCWLAWRLVCCDGEEVVLDGSRRIILMREIDIWYSDHLEPSRFHEGVFYARQREQTVSRYHRSHYRVSFLLLPACPLCSQDRAGFLQGVMPKWAS